MKLVEVKVRGEEVEDVVRLAERYRAFHAVHHGVTVEGDDGWARVLVNVPNEEVGPFVVAVGDGVEEAEFVIPVAENVPVSTPLGDIRERVEDVSSRSTLELVLDVLQSVGSWEGMLLYAVVSGLVAAYGVLFNVSFLLTAAMLIAPLGAPAMVCVVAVAMGDLWMLRRGGIRFVVALMVLAGAAALLGLAYGLTAPTEMMEMLTNLSLWSVLLGVAGGAAGAQALIQAERDSMVTATATGFLVAVSLSPPSAVMGLAVALGRWDYVALMAFLIVLTFLGILLGGWAALRYQNVGPERPSADRGSRTLVRVLVAGVIVVLAGLVGWQARQGPSYQKADRARYAAQSVREAVADVDGYRLLTASARFTPGDADWHPGEGLLLSVVVVEERQSAGDGTIEARDPAATVRAESALRAAIRERVESEMEGVRPFVELSIVPSGPDPVDAAPGAGGADRPGGG